MERSDAAAVMTRASSLELGQLARISLTAASAESDMMRMDIFATEKSAGSMGSMNDSMDLPKSAASTASRWDVCLTIALLLSSSCSRSASLIARSDPVKHGMDVAPPCTSPSIFLSAFMRWSHCSSIFPRASTVRISSNSVASALSDEKVCAGANGRE